MQVDIDADPSPVRDAEHDVEVGDRVTVEGARIETTDEVGPGSHGGIEQVGRARVAQDPRLRERHHLQVGPSCVRLTGRQNALQPVEPGVGVDLGVTANRRPTGRDRDTERAGRALLYGSSRRAPVPAVVQDQPGQPGLGGVRPEGQTETRRIEVGVDVGEGR